MAAHLRRLRCVSRLQSHDLRQRAGARVGVPDLRKKMMDLGLDVIGNSPAEFAEVIKTGTPAWAKIIKDARIKASDRAQWQVGQERSPSAVALGVPGALPHPPMGHYVIRHGLTFIKFSTYSLEEMTKPG